MVFSKEIFKLKETNCGKRTVREIELADNEKAALRLNPYFAILKYDEEHERDIELGLTKIRYEAWNRENRKEIGDIEYETREIKRIRIDAEIQDRNTERKREIEEAKERQIYNPLEKIFDFGKRRVTYIKENSKVHLPKPLKANEEGELEMIREILVGEFKKSIRKKYKKK